jgi:hypothetical protein
MLSSSFIDSEIAPAALPLSYQFHRLFDIAQRAFFGRLIFMMRCQQSMPRQSNPKNSGKTEFLYHREDRLWGRVNSRQAHLCLSKPSSIPCKAAIPFVNS